MVDVSGGERGHWGRGEIREVFMVRVGQKQGMHVMSVVRSHMCSCGSRRRMRLNPRSSHSRLRIKRSSMTVSSFITLMLYTPESLRARAEHPFDKQRKPAVYIDLCITRNMHFHGVTPCNITFSARAAIKYS